MSKTRILILAESLDWNISSAGFYSYMFTESLTANPDYHITVLYEDSFDNQVEFIGNIDLFQFTYTLPEPVWKKIPKIRALPSYILRLEYDTCRKITQWKKQITKILSKPFDVVFVLGKGSNIPHLALAEMNIPVPIIMNIHDPMPQSWYSPPYQTESNLFYRKKEKLIKKLARKSAAVTAPSEYMIYWMMKYMPCILEKSYVLPHTRFPDFYEKHYKGLNPKKENNTRFSIGHLGKLGRYRKVDTFVQAIKLFIERHQLTPSQFHIEFIGDIDKMQEEKIINHIPKEFYNISKNRISYLESIGIMQSLDLPVILEAPYIFSPFMPGKLADILYFKKPFLGITPKFSEIRRIMGMNYPYLADTNNTEDIFNKLTLAWEDWKEKGLSLANSKILKYYVSYDYFTKIFREIIINITS